MCRNLYIRLIIITIRSCIIHDDSLCVHIICVSLLCMRLYLYVSVFCLYSSVVVLQYGIYIHMCVCVSCVCLFDCFVVCVCVCVFVCFVVCLWFKLCGGPIQLLVCVNSLRKCV